MIECRSKNWSSGTCYEIQEVARSFLEPDHTRPTSGLKSESTIETTPRKIQEQVIVVAQTRPTLLLRAFMVLVYW